MAGRQPATADRTRAKYVPRAYTKEVTVHTGKKKDEDKRTNAEVVDIVNRVLGEGCGPRAGRQAPPQWRLEDYVRHRGSESRRRDSHSQ